MKRFGPPMIDRRMKRRQGRAATERRAMEDEVMALGDAAGKYHMQHDEPEQGRQPQRYALGFAFGYHGIREQLHVAMVQKVRPMWQAGNYNGIGGHVEPGESSLDAMVREFHEETGIYVPAICWEHFAIIAGGDDYTVVCYRHFGLNMQELRTLTDEIILPVPVEDVRIYPSLSNTNVPFLVYAALRMPGQCITINGNLEEGNE